MLRRSTHELLWLLVKAALVIGLAFPTPNWWVWVILAALAVHLVGLMEKASEKKHCLSEFDERMADRIALEEKVRRERGEA